MFYPRGSGLSYVFGGGLWFAARRKVGDTIYNLGFVTYDPKTGRAGQIPEHGEPDRTMQADTVIISVIRGTTIMRAASGPDQERGARDGRSGPMAMPCRRSSIRGSISKRPHAAIGITPDILRYLGKPANDHISYYAARPELWSGYTFSEETNGDERRFGTLLQTLLESPAVDSVASNGRYRFIRHDRHRYERSEQIGLTNYQYGEVLGVPLIMGRRCRMISARNLYPDLGAGDLQTLMATGPFDMLPGDTARFAIALSILASDGMVATRRLIISR